MAKVKNVGTALHIVSEISLENFKKLRNFKPEALELRDKDGNTFFVVDVEQNNGGISSFGITFDETKDGKLAITFIDSELPNDKKEYIAATYGKAIANLIQLEKQVAEEVKGYDKFIKEVEASVEVD